jgi:hypothetical protein
MDTNELIKMMKDQLMLEMISTISPNEQETTMLVAILQIFIKHGVHTDKALAIMKDLTEVINDNGKK